MSRGIRVSEKHGVNPSLIACWWCGEGDSIALFGRITDRKLKEQLGVEGQDPEAPHTAGPMNYEPCHGCKEKHALGVVMVEVLETDPGDRAPWPGHGTAEDGGRIEHFWPTGRWAVLRREAVERLVRPEEFAAKIVAKGLTVVPVEVFEALGCDQASRAAN